MSFVVLQMLLDKREELKEEKTCFFLKYITGKRTLNSSSPSRGICPVKWERICIQLFQLPIRKMATRDKVLGLGDKKKSPPRRLTSPFYPSPFYLMLTLAFMDSSQFCVGQKK